VNRRDSWTKRRRRGPAVATRFKSAARTVRPIAARRRSGSRRAPANRPWCCTRGSSRYRAASSRFCHSRDSLERMERPDARWAIAPSIAVRCRARTCARIIWGCSRSASVSGQHIVAAAMPMPHQSRDTACASPSLARVCVVLLYVRLARTRKGAAHAPRRVRCIDRARARARPWHGAHYAHAARIIGTRIDASSPREVHRYASPAGTRRDSIESLERKFFTRRMRLRVATMMEIRHQCLAGRQTLEHVSERHSNWHARFAFSCCLRCILERCLLFFLARNW